MTTSRYGTSRLGLVVLGCLALAGITAWLFSVGQRSAQENSVSRRVDTGQSTGGGNSTPTAEATLATQGQWLDGEKVVTGDMMVADERSVHLWVYESDVVAKGGISSVGQVKFNTVSGNPPPQPTNEAADELLFDTRAIWLYGTLIISPTDVYTGTQVDGWIVAQLGGQVGGYLHESPPTDRIKAAEQGIAFLIDIDNSLLQSGEPWIAAVIARRDQLNAAGGNYGMGILVEWAEYNVAAGTALGAYSGQQYSISELESIIDNN